MPVHVRGEYPAQAGAIVGCWAETGGGLCHVGILDRDALVHLGGEAAVVHMTNVMTGMMRGKVPAGVIGWLAALDEPRRRKVMLWAGRQMARRSEIRYVAHPAWEASSSLCDAENDGPLYRGFSCAGFVWASYREGASLELVIGHERLPCVPLDELKRLWPDQARGLEIPRLRARVGLVGDGPWPILLPIYLFQAILQADDDGEGSLPFAPRAHHRGSSLQ